MVTKSKHTVPLDKAHLQHPRGGLRGRKTKLTDEMTKALCFQLRHGAHNETACAAVGISVYAFYSWMSQGKRGHPVFGKFYTEVEKARAEVVQKLLEKAQRRVLSVDEGGQGADPLPLLAVVDRRYSPQVRIQVTAELSVALDRIEMEFRHEPQTLERILACLSEDTGGKEIAYLASGQNRIDEENAEDSGAPLPVEDSTDFSESGRP